MVLNISDGRTDVRLLLPLIFFEGQHTDEVKVWLISLRISTLSFRTVFSSKFACTGRDETLQICDQE